MLKSEPDREFGLDHVSLHMIRLMPIWTLAAQPATWQSWGAALVGAEPVVTEPDGWQCS